MLTSPSDLEVVAEADLQRLLRSTRTMPTALVSWPRSFSWKSRAERVHRAGGDAASSRSAASRALCPSGYETRSVAGMKPQIQRPSAERLVGLRAEGDARAAARRR